MESRPYSANGLGVLRYPLLALARCLCLVRVSQNGLDKADRADGFGFHTSYN